MYTTRIMHGTRVFGGKRGKRKIGKISRTVFHPTKPQVVGFIVKRPDLLWMFKRPDRFLALDSFSLVDGHAIVSPDTASWDAAAIKRLDIDYDTCILWENMPIKSREGIELGRVGNISFNEHTGKIRAIACTDGSAANAMLGSMEIPLEYFEGYEKGYLIVKAEASELELSGGIAAAAGRGAAKATKGVTIASAKAGKAINDGAYALGGIIGKAKNKAVDLKKSIGSEDESSDSDAEDVSDYEEEVADKQPVKKAAAPAKSSKSDIAARKVGEHLGKTKGMFAAFADEYRKGAGKDD